jgi:hypothetical protein
MSCGPYAIWAIAPRLRHGHLPARIPGLWLLLNFGHHLDTWMMFPSLLLIVPLLSCTGNRGILSRRHSRP